MSFNVNRYKTNYAFVCEYGSKKAFTLKSWKGTRNVTKGTWKFTKPYKGVKVLLRLVRRRPRRLSRLSFLCASLAAASRLRTKDARPLSSDMKAPRSAA